MTYINGKEMTGIIMKLGQFIDTYCQDILEESNQRKSYLGADDGLPYDDIVQDESGRPMKVVYSATRRIPIADILDSDRSEFAKVYSTPSDLETYDNYLNSIILMEGEEALEVIRKSVRNEMARIREFAKENGGSLASRMDE